MTRVNGYLLILGAIWRNRLVSRPASVRLPCGQHETAGDSYISDVWPSRREDQE